MKYTLDDFARLIDHTNLHADATHADMKKLCDEAKKYHFKMVAINQVQSAFCSKQLAGTLILAQLLPSLLVNNQLLQRSSTLKTLLKMEQMKLTT